MSYHITFSVSDLFFQALHCLDLSFWACCEDFCMSCRCFSVSRFHVSHLPGMQHCTDYSTWTGRWWAARGRRSAANPTERSRPSAWSTGSIARPTPPSTHLWRLWPPVGRARCRSRTGGYSSPSVSARYTGRGQIPGPDTPPGGGGGGPAGKGSPRLLGPPCTCGCGRFEVGTGCSWAPVWENVMGNGILEAY